MYANFGTRAGICHIAARPGAPSKWRLVGAVALFVEWSGEIAPAAG
jgi:hypothetical protein